MSNSDRVLIQAFKEISSMSDRISLPKNIVVCINVAYFIFGYVHTVLDFLQIACVTTSLPEFPTCQKLLLLRLLSY